MVRLVVSMAVAALVVSVSCVSVAASGAVILKKDGLYWGQYKNLTGALALDAAGAASQSESGASVPEGLKHLPLSGVGAVVCYCQQPGTPFFSKDGKEIAPSELERMRSDLDAIFKFDMLPVVVLFDPDPACRLDSPEAYENAAIAFMNAFEKDFWFLPCVSDQCAGWDGLDAVELAKGVTAAVKGQAKGQLVAAGGTDGAVNARLLSEAGVDALVARTGRIGAMDDLGAPFTMDILEATGDADVLAAAVQRTLDAPSKGVAFRLADAPGEKRAACADMLGTLHKAVDAYQKAKYPSAPPDSDDTHSLKPGEAEDGFVSLFNGKNLNGWVQLTVPDDFVVKDGAILLVKKPGGWLRSWNTYGNFVLRAEYRIQDKGNSGIYIRTAPVGRNSRIGFESQIMGDAADDPVRIDSVGAIYDVRPPDGNFIKPGEWNEVEITCIGTAVKIVLNGHVAHDIRYEDLEFMKNRPTMGYIGLQDHHNTVEFRSLRIKSLP